MKIALLSAFSLGCGLCSAAPQENAPASDETVQHVVRRPIFEPLQSAPVETMSLRGLVDATLSGVLPSAPERGDVEYFCDVLRRSLKDMDSPAKIEQIAYCIRGLQTIDPSSAPVNEMQKRFNRLLSDSNLQIEISENAISEMSAQSVERAVPVNEIISGATVRGSGVVRGRTRFDLLPASDGARARLILDAEITASTTSSKLGVNVFASSLGKYTAAKPLVFAPQGLVYSSSYANGSLNSTICNFTTPVTGPFNGAMVQRIIQREKPRFENEATRIFGGQVARDFDAEANVTLNSLNQRWLQLSGASSETPVEERLFRGMTARSDEDRLYLEFSVGREGQLAAPSEELAAVADLESGAPFGVYVDPEGPKDAGVARSGAVEFRSARKSDVVFRAYQSAPANAAFIALAGLKIGEGDIFDELVARFPGVDRDFVAFFLDKYRKEAATTENGLPERGVIAVFDSLNPMTIIFDGDRISTTLRFASLETTDGASQENVEMRFVYSVVSGANGVVFKREAVEVFPLDHPEGQKLPARFIPFRSVVMKRLEAAIMDEYALDAKGNALVYDFAGSPENPSMRICNEY
ncbi:MAG: hypothetical protein HUK22_02335, partial [Thermoguttaceae bacterium]|nr:hypothetical protein [Thermoguttaceae bacterium]